jgi:hypothetical protein
VSTHRTRFRILAVLAATALVTSISAAGAAASQQDSSRTVASSTAGHAQAATSSLAPCTAPLYGPDKDCESTSPVVDRWVTFHSGAQSCTYTQFVDWGDGSSSSRTFTNPIPAQYLIASHKYSTDTGTTIYTETVTSSVDSGTCEPIATTVFQFTYLSSVPAPWWVGLGISQACANDLYPDPIGVVGSEKDLGESLGLFKVAGRWAVLFGVLTVVDDVYGIYEVLFVIPKDCAVNKAYSLGPALPLAYAYGASHPGKLFKPKGRVLQPPHITGIYGYQKGSLVYFSLAYADPDHDAKGFGFVGIKGAGWAEENHSFSSPSYGIVGKDRIDYPFNLGCGTAHQYKSYVEAWIYDSQGIRSNPVQVALTCAT